MFFDSNIKSNISSDDGNIQDKISKGKNYPSEKILNAPEISREENESELSSSLQVSYSFNLNKFRFISTIYSYLFNKYN